MLETNPFRTHFEPISNPFRPFQAVRSGRQLVALLFAVVCSAGLAPGGTARAGDTSSAALERFVHQVEASYRDVRTLWADFKQTYNWGGRVRVESGTVYLARGGLMRWDYKTPLEKVFISDGKNLLLYVPADRQLTRTSLKSSEDVRVPLRLLLSRLKLRRVFARIEFADLPGQAGSALPRAPDDRVLRATPKPGFEQEYREVLIELTPAMDIRRLVVTYANRSVMEFEFEHIERNAALPAGLFRFTPPPGTEVIDQR